MGPISTAVPFRMSAGPMSVTGYVKVDTRIAALKRIAPAPEDILPTEPGMLDGFFYSIKQGKFLQTFTFNDINGNPTPIVCVTGSNTSIAIAVAPAKKANKDDEAEYHSEGAFTENVLYVYRPGEDVAIHFTLKPVIEMQFCPATDILVVTDGVDLMIIDKAAMPKRISRRNFRYVGIAAERTPVAMTADRSLFVYVPIDAYSYSWTEVPQPRFANDFYVNSKSYKFTTPGVFPEGPMFLPQCRKCFRLSGEEYRTSLETEGEPNVVSMEGHPDTKLLFILYERNQVVHTFYHPAPSKRGAEAPQISDITNFYQRLLVSRVEEMSNEQASPAPAAGRGGRSKVSLSSRAAGRLDVDIDDSAAKKLDTKSAYSAVTERLPAGTLDTPRVQERQFYHLRALSTEDTNFLEILFDVPLTMLNGGSPAHSANYAADLDPTKQATAEEKEKIARIMRSNEQLVKVLEEFIHDDGKDGGDSAREFLKNTLVLPPGVYHRPLPPSWGALHPYLRLKVSQLVVVPAKEQIALTCILALYQDLPYTTGFAKPSLNVVLKQIEWTYFFNIKPVDTLAVRLSQGIFDWQQLGTTLDSITNSIVNGGKPPLNADLVQQWKRQTDAMYHTIAGRKHGEAGENDDAKFLLNANDVTLHAWVSVNETYVAHLKPLIKEGAVSTNATARNTVSQATTNTSFDVVPQAAPTKKPARASSKPRAGSVAASSPAKAAPPRINVQVLHHTIVDPNDLHRTFIASHVDESLHVSMFADSDAADDRPLSLRQASVHFTRFGADMEYSLNIWKILGSTMLFLTIVFLNELLLPRFVQSTNETVMYELWVLPSLLFGFLCMVYSWAYQDFSRPFVSNAFQQDKYGIVLHYLVVSLFTVVVHAGALHFHVLDPVREAATWYGDRDNVDKILLHLFMTLLKCFFFTCVFFFNTSNVSLHQHLHMTSLVMWGLTAVLDSFMRTSAIWHPIRFLLPGNVCSDFPPKLFDATTMIMTAMGDFRGHPTFDGLVSFVKLAIRFSACEFAVSRVMLLGGIFFVGFQVLGAMAYNRRSRLYNAMTMFVESVGIGFTIF